MPTCATIIILLQAMSVNLWIEWGTQGLWLYSENSAKKKRVEDLKRSVWKKNFKKKNSRNHNFWSIKKLILNLKNESSKNKATDFSPGKHMKHFVYTVLVKIEAPPGEFLQIVVFLECKKYNK